MLLSLISAIIYTAAYDSDDLKTYYGGEAFDYSSELLVLFGSVDEAEWSQVRKSAAECTGDEISLEKGTASMQVQVGSPVMQATRRRTDFHLKLKLPVHRHSTLEKEIR